jgi:hypothetical protein
MKKFYIVLIFIGSFISILGFICMAFLVVALIDIIGAEFFLGGILCAVLAILSFLLGDAICRGKGLYKEDKNE